MTKVARLFMVLIQSSSSAPLIPPAGSFVVSFVNCLVESGPNTHKFPGRGGKKGKRRFSIYVPDELAPDVERAVRNGRSFQQLIVEAGRRYAMALKGERRSLSDG
jgi:hypothetical protein